MRQLSDDIVITEGNAAFQAVMDALNAEAPVRLVVCGPAGSGKTTVLQARGRERDLLAERKALYAHAQEILAAIDLEINESLLESVAEVDLLCLDGLDTLVAEGPRGCQTAQLLVDERNRRGLSTVIAFDGAPADLDRAAFGAALDDFEVAEVLPLDAAGLAEFGRRMAERFGAEEGAAVLSDEALAYLAADFAGSADEMRNAVRFLLTARGFEAGHVVTAADAREALAG